MDYTGAGFISGLIRDIGDDVNDADYRALVRDWCQEGIDSIFRRLPNSAFTITRNALNTVANTNGYSFSATNLYSENILSIRDKTLDRPLTYLDVKLITEYSLDLELKGQPVYYYIYGYDISTKQVQVFFHPIPNAVYNLEVTYRIKTYLFTDDSTIIYLPEHLLSILRHYVRAQAYRVEGNKANSDSEMQIFYLEIGEENKTKTSEAAYRQLRASDLPSITDDFNRSPVPFYGGGSASVGVSGVTSVGLITDDDDILDITLSPVTTSGDIKINFKSGNNNMFLATPDNSNGYPAYRNIVLNDIPSIPVTKLSATGGSALQLFRINSLGNGMEFFTLTAGTVTSVGVSGVTNILSVSNSPITTNGTISLSFDSQTQNKVFASPNGSSGSPTFRALVSGDIPDLSSIYSTKSAGGDLSGTLPNPTVSKINTVALGSTTATIGNLLIADGSQWVSTVISGDVTINGSGVTAIGNSKVTNTMLAGSIDNTKLSNSTISGIALGSNLASLTIGTGLSGSSYNGSSGVTISIDSTVATLTGSQTLQNKTLDNSTTINTKDTLFRLQDDGDSTKLLAFQLSNITSGNTRTLTVPNSSGTLVLEDLAQTLTNKTIDASSNSLSNITEAMQLLADNTTNNATTSRHGYLKKLNNDATYYMDGTGNWSIPSGGGGGGSGTVTSVSVVTANGVSGSVATATTTPAITITLGDITPSGVTVPDNKLFIQDNIDATKQLQFQCSSIGTGSIVTITIPNASGTLALTSNKLDAFAATTSAELKTVISDETGSGALVFANSPTLVTPTLGAASASSINGLTITSSTGTLTITNGKTVSFSNTLTFAGTDGSTVTFGGGGTVVYTSNKLSALSSTTSAELAGVISDETGSGALVFATSPSLVTPTLGVATATSINKVAITAPATSATLTIADGKTLTANASTTIGSISDQKLVYANGANNLTELSLGTGLSISSGTLNASNSAYTRDFFIVGYGTGSPSGVVCVGANNQVRCRRFFLDRKITIASLDLNITTIGSGSSGSFGVYSEDGNTLHVDSGSFSMGIGTTGKKSVTLGSPVTLNPGVYWLAWTQTGTTAAVTSWPNVTDLNTILNDITVCNGTAANSSSSGTLPSTLGTVSAGDFAVPVVKFQST